MPQPTKGARLGGSPAHQRLILANLATSLFQHGKITTTEAKAKRLRPYAERLITKAKRGDLHNRREIQKLIRDRETVHRLMHEIGPFFADRNGGYTRITKTLPRQGDNAPMAVIELVSQKTVTDEADRARRVAGSQRRPAATAAAPAAGGGDRARRPGRTPSTRPRAPRRPRPRRPRRRTEAAEARRPRPRPRRAPSTADAPYGEGSHAPLADAVRGAGGLPDQGQRGLEDLPRPRVAALRADRGRGLVRDAGGRRGRRVRAARRAGREVLISQYPDGPVVLTDGGLVAVPARIPGARRRRSRARPPGSGSTSPTTAPTSPAGRSSPAGARSPGVLTDALTAVLRGPVALTVAGRTDAGVHATGQVALGGPARRPRPGVAGAPAGPAAARRRPGHRGHAPCRRSSTPGSRRCAATTATGSPRRPGAPTRCAPATRWPGRTRWTSTP